MKTSYANALVLALAGLASSYASAGEQGFRDNTLSPAAVVSAGKSDAQVQAELAEALRTGDMAAPGNANSGKKLYEVYPGRYPAKAVAQGSNQQLAQAVPGADRWVLNRGHGNSAQ